MDIAEIAMLTVLIFAAAVLYSSVGHAGASGYLAAMALFGLPPEVMKPTALGLNILVAAIASVQYVRAGCFSWSLSWKLMLTSIPFALVGGAISLPKLIYQPIVGAVLIYAAGVILWRTGRESPCDSQPPRVEILLATGAGLGLLSGLTGVGGGIFLSPILVCFRWANVRQVSGICAVFILVNSCAGMAGLLLTSAASFPQVLPYWAIAAILGGSLGAELGSRRLAPPALRRLLAIVLLIAGGKLSLTAGLW